MVQSTRKITWSTFEPGFDTFEPKSDSIHMNGENGAFGFVGEGGGQQKERPGYEPFALHPHDGHVIPGYPGKPHPVTP